MSSEDKVVSGNVPENVFRQQTQQQDVTQEYLDKATPGKGEITYDDGYVTKNHQDEINMASWLKNTFGGDVRLLAEASSKGQTMPDYLWNEKYWELKNASSVGGADKRLQHALKQIQNNPGGVIMNLSEDINMEALERQLARRASHAKNTEFDLMILTNQELTKILRYQKR